MSKLALELQDVWHSYQLEGQFVPALRGLNLQIREGEMVAIQGPSGSGKSTLLYLLGCMLRPQRGDVRVFDQSVGEMSDLEMAFIRNHRLGFVFQQFHLLSRASVLENILLPSKYPFEAGAETTPQDIERAKDLARQIGLQDRLEHLPNQLSGGQQQRVAIARALLRDAPLILADEPTGNLDSHTSNEILKLLSDLNKQGRTIVIITHDPEVALRCQRVLHIRDGQIVDEQRNFAPPSEDKAIAPAPLQIPSRDTQSVLQRWISLIHDSAPLAMENLRRNRLRSLLTMLGVVIGVASVLSMVTLGQYTKRKMLQSYATMGVNSMQFYGYQNWGSSATDANPNVFNGMHFERDVKPLPTFVPEIKRYSPMYQAYSMTAVYGGRSIENEISVLGMNEFGLGIARRGVTQGTGVQPIHVKSKSSVCVIGFEVGERLFVQRSPIGESLQLNDENSSFSCIVVGVLEKAVTKGGEWSKPDMQVIVPHTYFQAGPFNYWYKDLGVLLIELFPGKDIEKTGKKIQNYFKRKYGTSGRFNAATDSVMVAQMNKFLTLFTILLGLIASLSLLVGAMGITNMMLVSVSERFREIGLRKALGASDHSVRLQFITESLFLCLLAGVIGIVLGILGYEGLILLGTKFIPTLQFEWIWDWTAALISIFAIGLTGFFSGLTPALKAEKLQVIEALRSE